ncbi:MAG: acyl-CoA dehydrogenase family protein [Sandaracinaceae bacterium]
MASFFHDNDDLRYYLQEGIDWAPLVEAGSGLTISPDAPSHLEEARELYGDIVQLVGEFAADVVAPQAAQIDREGVRLEDGEAVHPPRLQAIFDQMKELELHGMCLPTELGGLNCPAMLYFLTSEMIARADVSVMAHYGFHTGVALAMLSFSIREGTTRFDPDTGEILETRFADEIREIIRGDAWGCMDITEPDAGSDMAALRAKGELGDDGVWRVSGQKIFITAGHGKYHFVIARTEDSAGRSDAVAGLRGLSMFLVRAYREDADGRRERLATLDRLEEKLGHHASVTAALGFDRTPAELIGKRGEGFSYMLTLMNHARIGVGFECLGLCEAALRVAEAYAAERWSMGKPIARHELIADYLDGMRTDIQALRAVCVEAAFQEELAQREELALRVNSDMSDREWTRREHALRRHKAAARRTTPLIKYFGAEKAVEMARMAIQIHGGVGYTAEYGAEKLLRDAVVMPIYEGTSQIQSLMAMKDRLSDIMRNPRRFVRRAARARWRVLSSRDPLERRVAKLQGLAYQAELHLLMRTAGSKLRDISDRPPGEWLDALRGSWDPKRDFAFALLHAERLTRMLFDVAAAEVLYAQQRKSPARREVLERWLERAEPRCRFLLDEITTTGERLLASLRSEEGDAEAAA